VLRTCEAPGAAPGSCARAGLAEVRRHESHGVLMGAGPVLLGGLVADGRRVAQRSVLVAAWCTGSAELSSCYGRRGRGDASHVVLHGELAIDVGL